MRWSYGHGAVYSFITAAALLVVDILWVGTYTLLHGWAGVNALFGGSSITLSDVPAAPSGAGTVPIKLVPARRAATCRASSRAMTWTC